MIKKSEPSKNLYIPMPKIYKQDRNLMKFNIFLK